MEIIGAILLGVVLKTVFDAWRKKNEYDYTWVCPDCAYTKFASNNKDTLTRIGLHHTAIFHSDKKEAT